VNCQSIGFQSNIVLWIEEEAVGDGFEIGIIVFDINYYYSIPSGRLRCRIFDIMFLVASRNIHHTNTDFL